MHRPKSDFGELEERAIIKVVSFQKILFLFAGTRRGSQKQLLINGLKISASYFSNIYKRVLL
jgi:hypothetical protein